MGNFEEDMNIIVPVSLTDGGGGRERWRGWRGEGRGETCMYHAFAFSCVFTFLQQVDAVIAASKSVTSSQSFRKVLEVMISRNRFYPLSLHVRMWQIL